MRRRSTSATVLGVVFSLAVMHGLVAATPASAHGDHGEHEEGAAALSLCLLILSLAAVPAAPPRVVRRLPRFLPVRRMVGDIPIVSTRVTTPLRA